MKQTGPARLRLLLWSAQLLSVLVLTALAWWLPTVMQLAPAPAESSLAGGIAVALIPVTVLMARLFGIGAAEGAGYGVRHRHPKSSTASPCGDDGPLSRYMTVIVLAELPAVLGLVHVWLGGARPNAVLLGAASVVLLVLYRPYRPRATPLSQHTKRM